MNEARTHRRKKGTPKYQFVMDRLRKQIASGMYEPGARLPTLARLTEQLKVSSITVRHALRELVLQGLIVQRRGSGSYVADRVHPPRFPGKNMRIGILWRHALEPERLHKSFEGDITRGILDELGIQADQPKWLPAKRRDPLRAQWTSLDRGLTVEGLSQSKSSGVAHPPLRVVKEGEFDGLLSVGIIEDAWLGQLLNLDWPTVLVDYPSEAFECRADQIYFDPLPGIRAAVLRMAAKRLKRIHFIGGFTSVSVPSEDYSPSEIAGYVSSHKRLDPDTVPRLNAYRQAMQECGLEVKESWIHVGAYGGPKLRQLAEELLKRPACDRPEAVVCHSISQAQGMMKVFAEDDRPLGGAGVSHRESGGGALVIRADGYEMGRRAAALLLSRLERKDRPLFRVCVSMNL